MHDFVDTRIVGQLFWWNFRSQTRNSIDYVYTAVSIGWSLGSRVSKALFECTAFTMVSSSTVALAITKSRLPMDNYCYFW